jgi:histidinol-phosphate aminotransferase
MRYIAALERMVPYEPGRPLELVMREFGLDEVVKLASNEFPQPPFDEVKRAVVAALDDLNRYPDGHSTDLRAALAAHYERAPEQVAVGNGSCELLMLLGDVLLEKDDEVVFADPSFIVYNDICLRHEARAVTVPLVDFTHDLPAMAAAVTPRTKMLIVCNPNNPTGTYVPAAGIERLVAQVPSDVLIVIDEAYNEFVTAADSQEALELQARHDNVIVLRTFSKIYGLAGLRIGFAVADRAVIDVLNRVGRTFHVSSLAMVGAIAALDDHDHVAISAKHARAAIEQLRAAVRGPGVRAYPSLANFVLIDCGRPSGPVYDKLLRMGVIVRPMAMWGLPNHIRVSVAAHQDMPRVIEALNTALAAPA